MIHSSQSSSSSTAIICWTSRQQWPFGSPQSGGAIEIESQGHTLSIGWIIELGATARRRRMMYFMWQATRTRVEQQQCGYWLGAELAHWPATWCRPASSRPRGPWVHVEWAGRAHAPTRSKSLRGHHHAYQPIGDKVKPTTTKDSSTSHTSYVFGCLYLLMLASRDTMS